MSFPSAQRLVMLYSSIAPPLWLCAQPGHLPMPKPITLLTSGTRGDVQPYLALGLGLQAAGYRVVVATHANFRARPAPRRGALAGGGGVGWVLVWVGGGAPPKTFCWHGATDNRRSRST